jgi:chromosome segregation ATPase
MTARKTPLSDRLAELSAAVPAANQHARALEVEHRRVVAEIARLTDAIADAYSNNDEARAAKAIKQRAMLETGSLREAEERLEGARRAVSRAESERGMFAREHADALVAERRPDAVAAAQAVENAIEQLGEAHQRWQTVAAEVAGLLRLAGRDSRDMPTIPERLTDLVRDARRAGGVGVPPPIPGGNAALPLERAREAA